MKKRSTKLSIAFLMLVSLSASIYLNTISNELPNQTEILTVLPEDAPIESILPEVQVVKTVLSKFIEL